MRRKAKRARRLAWSAAIHRGWMFRTHAIEYGPPKGWRLAGTHEGMLSKGLCAVRIKT